MELTSAKQLISFCEETNTNISENVVRYEAFRSNVTEAVVRQKMAESLVVMKDSVKEGCMHSGGMAHLVKEYGLKLDRARKDGDLLGGALLEKIITYSLAISQLNADSGRIVACPTAGSCGIVPGVLLSVAEELKLEDEILIDALLVSAGIGTVSAVQGPISGAEGGCQAECGVASAMAAGSVIYLKGGSPRNIFSAAALALQNMLGLVCDPIASLVEVPCVSRNASSSANAVVAANMVLAGIKSFIPYDETILAMKKIGKMMPESLRETSRGGLAGTPTGKAIYKRLQAKNEYIEK